MNIELSKMEENNFFGYNEGKIISYRTVMIGQIEQRIEWSIHSCWKFAFNSFNIFCKKVFDRESMKYWYQVY